jgi:hypothetical protein
MERCGVYNRVRHWGDGSTKAGAACFRSMVNTKTVFSKGDTERQAVGGGFRLHTTDTEVFSMGGR